MKNYLTKFILSLFLVAVSLPLAAEFEGGDPPTPTTGPSEGAGAFASPIDMYVYILAIVAMAMIVVYAKKIKKQTV